MLISQGAIYSFLNLFIDFSFDQFQSPEQSCIYWVYRLLLLQENPNCLLIITPKGGHLGWVAGVEALRGAPWTDPVVMDYLEHLERGASKGLASCSNSDYAQQYAEGFCKA